MRAAIKQTNVGTIALERYAGGKTVDHTVIRTMDLPISHQKYCPLGYQSLFCITTIVYFSNKLTFGVRTKEITHNWRTKAWKLTWEVLEEKRKNGRTKNLHKKDQHVYNNCYELRSRAIKQH